jgi:hypothetical protein
MGATDTKTRIKEFVGDSKAKLLLVSSLLGMSRVVISLPFEHPFEVMRVTWQTNSHLKNEVDVFKDVKQNKGVKGFYSGYTTNFAKQFSKSIYRYPLLSACPRFYSKMFGSTYEQNKHKMKFLTSATIALVEATIITPFERLQVFVMTSKNTNQNYSAFYKMISESSIRKEIFKGYTPYLTRQMVAWTSFLQADTFVKGQVRKFYNIPEEEMIKGLRLVFCSAFVSMFTILCAMPFDNIKTFLQKYNLELKKNTEGKIIKKENSIPKAIKHIYRTRGVFGFFIGWRVKLVAYFINAVFTVSLLEWLDNLSKEAFDKKEISKK